jgi:hypothetical protein
LNPRSPAPEAGGLNQALLHPELAAAQVPEAVVAEFGILCLTVWLQPQKVDGSRTRMCVSSGRRARSPEHPVGVEPTHPAWEAGRLPLHHGCLCHSPRCQRAVTTETRQAAPSNRKGQASSCDAWPRLVFGILHGSHGRGESGPRVRRTGGATPRRIRPRNHTDAETRHRSLSGFVGPASGHSPRHLDRTLE